MSLWPLRERFNKKADMNSPPLFNEASIIPLALPARTSLRYVLKITNTSEAIINQQTNCTQCLEGVILAAGTQSEFMYLETTMYHVP